MSSPRPLHLRIHRAAFSLIELLVAMAVLAVLLILLTQVFSMVSGIWNAGRSQADNFAQARVALDVMGRDLQAAVLRPDLPAFFVGGAPELAFYTKQQSLASATNSGNRPLSQVSYVVTNTIDGSSLRRSARGFNFGEDVGYSPTNWTMPAGQTTFDSDIGPGVLIARHQFIATNGLNILPSAVAEGWADSGTRPGVSSLRAVTLSLAVVDRDSLRLLRESGKLDQLLQNFSGSNPGGIRSFAAAWQDQLDDSSSPLAQGGVPIRILRNLKIFERTVVLPISKE